MEIRNIGFGKMAASTLKRGMIIETMAGQKRVVLQTRNALNGTFKAITSTSEQNLVHGGSTTTMHPKNEILNYDLVGWIAQKARKELRKPNSH